MSKARVRAIDRVEPETSPCLTEGNRGRGFAAHPENINRKGRPRAGRSLSELIRSKGDEGGFNENIIEALARKASDGDATSAKLLWDRGWGQSPMTIEMNTSDHTLTVERVMSKTRDFFITRHPEFVDEYVEYMKREEAA